MSSATIRCCNKSLCLEGEIEKLSTIEKICCLVGATQPELGTFEIPDYWGDSAVNVFEYIWKHLNE